MADVFEQDFVGVVQLGEQRERGIHCWASFPSDSAGFLVAFSISRVDVEALACGNATRDG